MNSADRAESIRLLEEICEDCQCTKTKQYCTLKTIVTHSALSDRFLIQVKCVEKFKYEQSEKEGRDIGDDGAWNRWIEMGFAKRFSDVFEKSKVKSFKKIYKETINDKC